MALPTKDSFTFNHADQTDYPAWTPAQTKAYLDARGEELRLHSKLIVTLLNSVTAGASGAKNVAMTPIAVIGTQADVQDVIEALITRLQAITAGASGAKFTGVESISGLTGNDVQTLLTALKTYIDAYKAELATTVGAGEVGAIAPSGLTGTTTQAILNALKTAIDNVVMGGIAAGTITDDMLSSLAGQIKNRFTLHLTDSIFQTAGGTATAITLTGVVLDDGHPKTFIASFDNGAVATTINALPVYKQGTTTAPTFKAGKAYVIWYNVAGSRFFCKASATGTATPAQVLAPVPFSNEDDTDLVGTMPDFGATSQPSSVYAVNGTSLYLTSGVTGKVTAGQTSIYATDADFVSSNILSGKNIFGLDGTTKQAPTSAAGDSVLYDNVKTAGPSTSISYVKIKETQISTLNLITGTVRTKFGMVSGYSGNYVYGQIWKNGVPVGVEHSLNSTTMAYFTDDISVSEGDLIQLYVHTSSSSYAVSVANSLSISINLNILGTFVSNL